MAYRKNFRRRRSMSRRRNFRNKRRSMMRRRRRPRSTRYAMVSQAIPVRYYCKLRYAYTAQQLVPDIGAIKRQIWRMNGLFDPDLSGTGHQPYLYDQLSLLYSRYRVFGCKIEVWAQQDSTSKKPVYIAFMPTTTPNTITSPDVMMETIGSRMIMLSADMSPRYMKKFYRPSTTFNVSKLEYNTDKNYSGLTGNAGSGSDPTSVASIEMMAYTLDSGLTINFTTRLTYYCVFFDKRQNTIS